MAAVEKLTDQALLTRVAFEDKNWTVRHTAVETLPSAHRLYKIALISIEEVKKQSDQVLLAEIAKIATDTEVQLAAIEKVTDQVVIAMVLDELAFTLTSPVARIRLAIQEPRIKFRFPGLKSIVEESKPSKDYSDLNSPKYTIHKVYGELVNIKLQQDGITFAEASWQTYFSEHIIGEFDSTANVHGEDLLEKLLHLSVFMQEDLAELVHSSIREVRAGAVANLTDQVLLAKVAVEDKEFDVRKAAKKRIANLSEVDNN